MSEFLSREPTEEDYDFGTPIVFPQQLSSTLSEDQAKKLESLQVELAKIKSKRGRKSKSNAEKERIDQIEKEIREIKGGGYTDHGYNICPDSVINDVSRLEVLIGGKRAGNNSPEIINEATGICQRLFQNKMIDTHIYRELIDELIDD